MNTKHILVPGALAVLCASWSLSAHTGGAAPSRPRAASVLAFDELSLHFEVDLPSSPSSGRYQVPQARFLDLPAEVVLAVDSPYAFTHLRVLDAAWNVVFELSQPRRTSSGLAEIELECEGATLRDVMRDFPCGPYFVQAKAVDGDPIEGRVTLAARLPGFFSVVAPLPGARVPCDDLTLAWTPAQGAVGYTLEIEQAELGFGLEVQLPASQTSFVVPGQLLRPGETYEYSLAVQGDTDNELEIEGGFYVSSPAR